MKLEPISKKILCGGFSQQPNTTATYKRNVYPQTIKIIIIIFIIYYYL